MLIPRYGFDNPAWSSYGNLRQYSRAGFNGTAIFGGTTTESSWSSTIPCSFPTSKNSTISSLVMNEHSAWKTRDKPKDDHQSSHPQTRLSITASIDTAQEFKSFDFNALSRDSYATTTIQERSKSSKRKASDNGDNVDLDLSLRLTATDHKKSRRSGLGEDEVDSSLSLSLSSNRFSKTITRLKGEAADSSNLKGKRTSTLDLTI